MTKEALTRSLFDCCFCSSHPPTHERSIRFHDVHEDDDDDGRNQTRVPIKHTRTKQN